jgi:hypothetical protein
MTKRKKLLWWVVVPGLLTVLTLAVISLILLSPPYLRRKAETTLSTQLNLDVTVEDLSLSVWPRPHVSGRGVTLKLPGRPDLPPFITIDHFSVNVGLLSALRKHVRTVHAGGLRINVPPGDARQALSSGGPSGDGTMSDVIIDEFITHDAELLFVRRKPGQRPLTFKIHDLTVRDIGFNRRMPYDARLTNPIPQGLVKAAGTIGPWLKEAPTDTPLDGSYTFVDADLGTINGIGGTLQSTGTFTGQLTSINAKGTSEVPDFSLDLGGKPVHLTATFDTTVDGTDGTTVLNRVEAKILNTPMVVTGAITNLEGPGRHQVELHVEIADGRIEDLMVMAIDSPQAPMTGDVALKSSFNLPPGPSRVRDRLELSGEFGLGKARFTDKDVQSKMQELSRRSQGKDKDDPLGRVMTSLKGKFRISKGRLTLPNLVFEVPGANVTLRGTYGLATGALDFRGTLKMKATVSKAMGGFKSIFLKPFDRIFRKEGAGAVVPIKITGNRKDPKFGLEIGRVFKKGD